MKAINAKITGLFDVKGKKEKKSLLFLPVHWCGEMVVPLTKLTNKEGEEGSGGNVSLWIIKMKTSKKLLGDDVQNSSKINPKL